MRMKRGVERRENGTIGEENTIKRRIAEQVEMPKRAENWSKKLQECKD